VSTLHDLAYRATWLTLQSCYRAGADQAAEVRRLYRLMSGVLRPVALFLLEQPLGDGTVAAPTFEPLDVPAAELDQRLAALAHEVAASHPTLAPVAATVSNLTRPSVPPSEQ
jgi:hypothetical protein